MAGINAGLKARVLCSNPVIVWSSNVLFLYIYIYIYLLTNLFILSNLFGMVVLRKEKGHI